MKLFRSLRKKRITEKSRRTKNRIGIGKRSLMLQSLEDRRLLAVGALEMPNPGSMGAENSWVQSPVLNVPSSPLTVQFDSLTLNETGFPTYYDVEWVEYSSNGGATWSAMHGLVPQLHSATNQSNHVVISAAVTPSANARVRLRLDTGDGCCGSGGWKVDNVNIGGALFDFNTGFQGWTTGNNPTTSLGQTSRSSTWTTTGAFGNFNQPPTADPGGPYSVSEDGSIGLTGSGSDPDGNPLTYQWDLDGDGIFGEAGGARGDETQQNPTFSAAGLDGPSTFYVSLRTDDGSVFSPVNTAIITVTNVAPSNLLLSLSATSINENGSTVLSGTFDDPGTLDEHTVDIDWGDGSPIQTVNLAAGVTSFSGISHTFLDDGDYAVTVTVTDDDGGVHGDTTVITVNNVAPIANAGADQTVDEGDLVTLNGTFTDVGVDDGHLQEWSVVTSNGQLIAGQTTGSVGGGPESVFANIPEANNYTLVYDLAIPNYNADYNSSPVPYTTDNSASIADASFDRIAYYLELDDGSGLDYVYVSMDAFTTVAAEIGVPVAATGAEFQQILTNMNVVSNVPGVVTGSDISTGNIEFWSDCYTTGSTLGLPGANNGTYDFDDSHASTSCYGSMQIHNYGAAQTVFAYNAWDNTAGSGDDLGIGNSPVGAHSDWTFRYNSGSYTVKNLQVLARTGGDSDGSGGDSFSFTPTDNGTYTVSYQVTDDDGGVHTDEAVITVNNAAPTPSNLAVTSPVNENDFVTLSGTIGDPAATTTSPTTFETFTLDMDWADGNTNSIALGTTDLTAVNIGGDIVTWNATTRNFSVDHQYLDDNPTGTPSDTSTISITVLDDDGGSTASSIDVVVNNVDPSFVPSSLTADTLVFPGDPVNVAGLFADVSADAHTVSIDWGDGNVTAASVDNLLDSFSDSSSYTEPGEYEITATVTDDDGGSIQESITVSILGIGLHGNTFELEGSDEGDYFYIGKSGSRWYLRSVVGGRSSASYVPIQPGMQVVANLHGGNDRFYVASSVNMPMQIDGGKGNDTLQGSSAVDVIIGGEGNDYLYGRAGDDILDGGAGADYLYGDAGDDTMFGGLGNDVMYGKYGNDIMFGNEGNDSIRGGSGDDTIYGGIGKDRLYGNYGKDKLYGNIAGVNDADADYIRGDQDADDVYGDAGLDTIIADALDNVNLF